MSGRRKILLFFVGLLVLIDTAVLFPSKRDEPERLPASSNIAFQLDIDRAMDIYFAENEVPDLLTFDPEKLRWSHAGSEIESLAPHVLGLVPEPHGMIPPYVLVSLSNEPTAGDYQAMVASLNDMGICWVGVLIPGLQRHHVERNFDGSEWPPSDFVTIHHIGKVRRKDGSYQQLFDRVRK